MLKVQLDKVKNMTVWKKKVERKQKAAFADHLKAEKWYQ